MYFPVLRAKQNELIGIRELAERVDAQTVRPVFEPVREKVDSLLKTVCHLNQYGIEPLLIINPSLGDFSNEDINFMDLIESADYPELKFLPCFSTKNNKIDLAEKFLNTLDSFALYLEGSYSKEWEPYIARAEIVLILGDAPPKLLESAKKRVYIADAFQAQNKNKDYPEVSNFNSNWLTEYEDRRNCIGFGDYTILDTDYSESGGPAYVVTLHLSYIDANEYDAIKVRHFQSYDDNSPTQPGLKFKSALDSLIKYVNENTHLFFISFGIENFRTLYTQKHFPGLGQVKKNSIQHHIETITDYLYKKSRG
jgi:hypothetical protein